MEKERQVPEFTDDQKKFIDRKTGEVYLIVLLGMTYDYKELNKFGTTLVQECNEHGLDPDIVNCEMKKEFIARVDKYLETLDEKVRSDLEEMKYIGPMFIDEKFGKFD